MGNAAGVFNSSNMSETAFSNKSLVADSSIEINGITFKPNFFLLDNVEASTPGPFSYGKITKALVKTCEASWIKIVSNYKVGAGGKGPGREKSRIHMFFDAFFANFERVDISGEAMPKFDVHPRSYIPNRDALLLRLIRYLLSVPNDSFKVKTKLRSLGRAHARRGIDEKHFRVFCQALMMTFIETLERAATHTVVSAWVELLSFVMHQMAFDKVFFIPRAHEMKGLSSSKKSQNSSTYREDATTGEFSSEYLCSGSAAELSDCEHDEIVEVEPDEVVAARNALLEIESEVGLIPSPRGRSTARGMARGTGGENGAAPPVGETSQPSETFLANNNLSEIDVGLMC